MGFVKTKDGVEIFYKDWGKGQPIVFSHGWPLSADDWDTQMLFFLKQRLSRHRPRPPRPWPVHPGQRRSRHGSLCRRPGGADGASRPEGRHSRRPFHRRRRGGPLSRTARRKPGREGGAHQRGAADHGEDAGQSRAACRSRCSTASAQGARRQPRAVLLDVATGPFYGFNRPGAKVIQGVIQNWWRQGMMGGAKAHYDCIKAFSETDFTEDLKKITVPVLLMHGDDDQIVPYADSAPLSAKLLKNGTLKTYKDFPHGMPATQADTINADLLAFLRSGAAARTAA